MVYIDGHKTKLFDYLARVRHLMEDHASGFSFFI